MATRKENKAKDTTTDTKKKKVTLKKIKSQDKNSTKRYGGKINKEDF